MDIVERLKSYPNAAKIEIEAADEITTLRAKLAEAERDAARYKLLHERAKRLIEGADFQLGGCLSKDSDASDIPSRAGSIVKTRHLARLRESVSAIDAAMHTTSHDKEVG